MDTSFNTTGFLELPSPVLGDDSSAQAMIEDDRGRIVVSGHGHIGTNQGVMAWRATESGSLDSSFANSGLFFDDVGDAGIFENSRSLTQHPEGYIFFGGGGNPNAIPSQTDLMLWKLK